LIGGAIDAAVISPPNDLALEDRYLVRFREQ
jgi:hypothetical protein